MLMNFYVDISLLFKIFFNIIQIISILNYLYNMYLINVQDNFKKTIVL